MPCCVHFGRGLVWLVCCEMVAMSSESLFLNSVVIQPPAPESSATTH